VIDFKGSMPDPAAPDIWVLTTNAGNISSNHAFGAAVDYWTEDFLVNLSPVQLSSLAKLLSDLLSKTLAEAASR
jgi:hypothetical protein